jgi:hypothetical protein
LSSIPKIADEYTRECLAIDVARKLTSEDVLERLSDLFVPAAQLTGAIPWQGNPGNRNWVYQWGQVEMPIAKNTPATSSPTTRRPAASFPKNQGGQPSGCHEVGRGLAA